MDFDSVWTLFVFIIGIGGWILDRMKKAKEENERRQRGPVAPAGRPAEPTREAPEGAPAGSQEKSEDPFEELKRFLEEAQKKTEPASKPSPAPRPPPERPRPALAQKAERSVLKRPRPIDKVIRPELLRVEKPVRRVVPAPVPVPAPESAAEARERPAARPPVRPSVHPLRASLHDRRSLRAVLVSAEVLGPPVALRTPGARPF